MTNALAAVRLAAALAAILGVAGCEGHDVVSLSNVLDGESVGLLVDAADAGGTFNDRGFLADAYSVNAALPAARGTRATIEVGDLRESRFANEVLAFSMDRPPLYLAAAWSDAPDGVRGRFRGPLSIDVTAWIVSGPFEPQREHALLAAVRTLEIFEAERMGVHFGVFELRDATSDPDAAGVLDPRPADTPWFGRVQDAIGFVPGRLNVYWVRSVDGGTGRGYSDGGARILMARDTGDELLAHEIGHALALQHVDSLDDFDRENVMHSASSTRQYFTEGQLFRAHLEPYSVLNALYGTRDGDLTRSCFLVRESEICPRLGRRLWADGAFPPS